ncbi:hypothetical protein [Varibaculum vaginae]|uniref:hypothetical protein n=1 Tax=Varibaculum vaginae TaxID=2364797 RepID=UPI000F07FBE3|nr:hypothetical protein [Varibaculum vaginae]
MNTKKQSRRDNHGNVISTPLPSRISAARRKKIRFHRRAAIGALVAVTALFSGGIVVFENTPSQAQEVSVTWKNRGDQDAQLYARKSIDGAKVAVCATDRQSNSPENVAVTYQNVRTIGPGQEYRSNEKTFDINYRQRGSGLIFPAETQQRAAYLVNYLRSAVDKDDNELAATVYAIHGLAGRLLPMQTQSEKVKQRGNQLLAQAQMYSGPYRAEGLELNFIPGRTRGMLRVPVVKSAAGQELNGLKKTITLSGPAHFNGEGSPRSITVTSGQRQAEIPVEVSAPGKVTVQVSITGLPPTSYQVWEDERWQDLLIAGAPSQLSVNAEAEANPHQEFAVKTETHSEMTRQDKGMKLIDMVRVKPEGEWGKRTDQDVWQTLLVDLALYGPFSSTRDAGEIPSGVKPVKTWQISATPNSEEEAKSGVSVSNEKDPYVAERPGFYTFVAAVHRSSQPEGTYLKSDYVPSFFEEEETQVLPFAPQVKTQVKVVSKQEDKILTDRVELSGFPDDHPDFAGNGKWRSDEKIVRNDLYCLPQPIKDQDAKGKKPLASIEVPAQNGTFTVDKDKEGKPLSLKRLSCKDTYVFVTTYKGDTRTQAFRSSETEISEQYSEPVEFIPPAVQTLLAKTGGSFSEALGLGFLLVGSGGILLYYRARRR